MRIIDIYLSDIRQNVISVQLDTPISIINDTIKKQGSAASKKRPKRSKILF